jgi:hypothetical protein
MRWSWPEVICQMLDLSWALKLRSSWTVMQLDDVQVSGIQCGNKTRFVQFHIAARCAVMVTVL